MNVYFDTEFTGLIPRASLISIGLITEDNDMCYLEMSKECIPAYAFENPWIKKHVIDNLIEPVSGVVYSEKEMAEKLREFFSKIGQEVQLVSDVCHYDMVLLCNLFGGAFELPKNVVPSCYDINQDIARYLEISPAKAFDISREGFVIKHCKNPLNLRSLEEKKT